VGSNKLRQRCGWSPVVSLEVRTDRCPALQGTTRPPLNATYHIAPRAKTTAVSSRNRSVTALAKELYRPAVVKDTSKMRFRRRVVTFPRSTSLPNCLGLASSAAWLAQPWTSHLGCHSIPLRQTRRQEQALTYPVSTLGRGPCCSRPHRLHASSCGREPHGGAALARHLRSSHCCMQ
jgi:hypothetical protein